MLKRRITCLLTCLGLISSNFVTGANVGKVKATTMSSETPEIVWGDANMDWDVSVADPLRIMQCLVEPDNFGMDREAADVHMNGDGVTAEDALIIQLYLEGKVETLPESYLIPIETTTTTATTTTTTSTTTSTSTTTTTTAKPTTTSTTTTTTTTTAKPTTTSTTATTTTSTTTTTTTTETTTTTVVEPIVSYYYRYDGEFYYSADDDDPDCLAICEGCDSYDTFVATAQALGIENYKIVYSKEVIPYAFIYTTELVHHDTYGDHLEMRNKMAQIVPLSKSELDKICPGLYDSFIEDQEMTPEQYGYDYVVWYPDTDGDACQFNCGNSHYMCGTGYNAFFVDILPECFQLIPTDENGNDILTLGGGIESYIASLH